MEILQTSLAVISGCLVALKSFTWVAEWLLGIWDQLKRGKEESRNLAALLAAVFLFAGPWVLVILVALVAKFKDAWWAMWVACGFGAGLLFIAGTTILTIRGHRKERDKNAA